MSVLEGLWPWQQDALNAWRSNNYAGIVAAATGTGKTRVALACWDHLRTHEPPLKTLVVVPTVRLQEQWVQEIKVNLGIRDSSIGRLGGGEFSLGKRKEVVVAVINSAREQAEDILEGWSGPGVKKLLVVDECHDDTPGVTNHNLRSDDYHSGGNHHHRGRR